ncbi:hypothetical protein FQN49_007760 [Arthroderma sp. PD_2]|nr:hypothetical protein FQN49_007760 [Arthroderma sp. PD_2]
MQIYSLLRAGLYGSTVDIRYGSGFRLPLVLTVNDASKILAATHFQNTRPGSGDNLSPKLPQELRDMIYEFALPDDKWQKRDTNNEFDTSAFFTGLGDPSGLYFPPSKTLGALALNREIRLEALPLAYQNTPFHFDNIDDFIRFGISIGSIGRGNVTSLEFAWESRADFFPPSLLTSDQDDLLGRLPSIHVLRCIKLLRELRKLKRLRLWFDSDI